jgi:transposase
MRHGVESRTKLMGHRGRKDDPLYQIRRLLTKADERLTEAGRTKLMGLLKAGDPYGEVATAWQAKEAIRKIYTHTNHPVTVEDVPRLGKDPQDSENPPEVRSLGRTLTR